MENNFQNTDQGQNLNQENEMEISNDNKKSRIGLYEKLMFFIFIIFAIPLYLFIIKNGSYNQPSYTNQKTANLEPIQGPTLTPTPVLLQSANDINNAIKSLDSEDYRRFDGSISQIKMYTSTLEN